jgi:hypothetical protein
MRFKSVSLYEVTHSGRPNRDRNSVVQISFNVCSFSVTREFPPSHKSNGSSVMGGKRSNFMSLDRADLKISSDGARKETFETVDRKREKMFSERSWSRAL